MYSKGLLVIISGPAGSGKSTIADETIIRSGGEISRVITATTRSPRPNEKNGRDYIFLSREEFTKGIAEGKFVEYNEFNDNLYGTPRNILDEMLRREKVILLVVDVNGGEAIKKIYPDCLRIFVLPPTPEKLRVRLSKRGTESKMDIESRLYIAQQEIELLESYDEIIINDDLDLAVFDALTIIKVSHMHQIRGGELEHWKKGLYEHWHDLQRKN